MTYIPDCREDECYNQKYLNDKDAEFVAGFDWYRINALENFFDNIDIYGDEFEGLENPEEAEKAEKFYELLEDDTIREILKECLVHYSEMERDELITSMIDNMSEEEFEKIKKEVDKGKRINCLAEYKFETDPQGVWED